MKILKQRWAGIVLTALSLFLTIGVKTVFAACGPKEDGSWMACHWAEQAVFASGIVLSCISVMILLISDEKVRLGLSLAVIPAAAVTALIPGVFSGLCMMTNMHCHTVTRPSVTVISVLIAAAALVDVIIKLRIRKGGSR